MDERTQQDKVAYDRAIQDLQVAGKEVTIENVCSHMHIFFFKEPDKGMIGQALRQQGFKAVCKDSYIMYHQWAAGTAPGWSICISCGLPAVCPECLPLGAQLTEGINIRECIAHQTAKWMPRPVEELLNEQ